jgi:REP element-mobilizing transposase RayT
MATTSDDPLAYFITWTVYGSHLQGDQDGWRLRRKGQQIPQPRLAQWHRERLKHDVILLSADQRKAVEAECERHCRHRRWHLWAANARTSHVHIVVTADGSSGKTVRDQLKANCTRGLRARWREYCDRAIWTVGGDWQCINSQQDLETVCLYVREAQDRVQYKSAAGR